MWGRWAYLLGRDVDEKNIGSLTRAAIALICTLIVVCKSRLAWSMMSLSYDFLPESGLELWQLFMSQKPHLSHPCFTGHLPTRAWLTLFFNGELLSFLLSLCTPINYSFTLRGLCLAAQEWLDPFRACSFGVHKVGEEYILNELHYWCFTDLPPAPWKIPRDKY